MNETRASGVLATCASVTILPFSPITQIRRACQRYIQPDTDIHVVALSSLGIGARLAARPREHAKRVRATTPDSPSSRKTPAVQVYAEPHYGICSVRAPRSSARTSASFRSRSFGLRSRRPAVSLRQMIGSRTRRLAASAGGALPGDRAAGCASGPGSIGARR